MPSFIISGQGRPKQKMSNKPIRNSWEEMKKAHRKAKGFK